MKVKDIRVTVVVVPFSQPETWVYGRCWGLTNAVLEVETDEGIIGLGEAPGHCQRRHRVQDHRDAQARDHRS